LPLFYRFKLKVLPWPEEHRIVFISDGHNTNAESLGCFKLFALALCFFFWRKKNG